MINIAILDDHKLFTDALKNVLPNYGDYSVVGTACNKKELFTILESVHVDIALLDVNLPNNISGFDILVEIKDRFKHIKCIMVTMKTHKNYVLKAQELGASGYLKKESGAGSLIQGIESILQNAKFYTDIKSSSINPFDSLTKTETKVLMEIFKSKSNSEIALEFNRSKETIDSHRKNIYQTLEINNIIDLVKLGMKHGLIEP